jgi:hypothetical protein
MSSKEQKTLYSSCTVDVLRIPGIRLVATLSLLIVQFKTNGKQIESITPCAASEQPHVFGVAGSNIRLNKHTPFLDNVTNDVPLLALIFPFHYPCKFEYLFVRCAACIIKIC